MICPGKKGQAKIRVCQENTAVFLKSGRLEVFATPAMVALMEEASVSAVSAFLDEGVETVGTKISVSHLSATPVGIWVTAFATLEEVDGRRLVFSVEAFDEKGKIGYGTHERMLVDSLKVMQKTLKKN